MFTSLGPSRSRRAGAHGRTLKQQAWDSTAYVNHPHTTGDPTQAINGSLEHLRGATKGPTNPRNYRPHHLLHSGGLRHHPHP